MSAVLELVRSCFYLFFCKNASGQLCLIEAVGKKEIGMRNSLQSTYHEDKPDHCKFKSRGIQRDSF